MRLALVEVVLVLLAAGCNSRVEPEPSATTPFQEASQAPEQQPGPQSGPFTPEQWLATPAYKKANPYDLPLQYEIEIPELPPEGLMDPAPELPPDAGEGAGG